MKKQYKGLLTPTGKSPQTGILLMFQDIVHRYFFSKSLTDLKC